jgi:large subunit ribosomal protein L19
MDTLIQNFSRKYCKASVPDLRTGYLVCVHQKIKEGNKERIQKFQGTVIKTNSGNGVSSSFTVRKISEGIGVEKTYLIHSPSIVQVDVLRAHKVRRAKLYFLRDLSGKALRLKEIPLNLKTIEIKGDEILVESLPEGLQDEGTDEEVIVDEELETEK